MTALPPWDYTEVARKSDVELAESRLEAKIDAQFHRLVAFFLPLFGVAGLVLAAVALA